jgi:hypothetical protein
MSLAGKEALCLGPKLNPRVGIVALAMVKDPLRTPGKGTAVGCNFGQRFKGLLAVASEALVTSKAPIQRISATVQAPDLASRNGEPPINLAKRPRQPSAGFSWSSTF